MLLNTGTEAVDSRHGLLTTVGYKLGSHAETNYALEGGQGRREVGRVQEGLWGCLYAGLLKL